MGNLPAYSTTVFLRRLQLTDVLRIGEGKATRLGHDAAWRSSGA